MEVSEKSVVSAYPAKDQRTIFKYLEKYAEPESNYSTPILQYIKEKPWDFVVTIPACGEDAFLPGALNSINDCLAVENHSRILCLVVLNGNEAREAEYGQSNERMRSWFNKHCTTVTSTLNSEGCCPQSLVRWKNIDILIVDRSQPPWLIPSRHGVGLVRKIAADCALALIVAGKIKSLWIHATDADARVPVDYFMKATEYIKTAKDSIKPVSCFIYPYQHIPDPEMEKQEHQRYWSALTDYELWLRYYVAGLQWANSSYAYPSIGSLLACDALAYARIRGFPKRMAGEDFYFQNKLAKIGQMVMLQGTPVELLTRASTRVPFGTGQGTISIEKMNADGSTYEVYHPDVFSFLKSFNGAVFEWFDHPQADEELCQARFRHHLEQSLNNHEKSPAAKDLWLQKLLTELDIFNMLQSAEKRSRSAPGAYRQFNNWFDSFKTLKLIHRLRDDLYGTLPLLEALQKSAFLSFSDSPLDVEAIQMSWLSALRAIKGPRVTEPEG